MTPPRFHPRYLSAVAAVTALLVLGTAVPSFADDVPEPTDTSAPSSTQVDLDTSSTPEAEDLEPAETPALTPAPPAESLAPSAASPVEASRESVGPSGGGAPVVQLDAASVSGSPIVGKTLTAVVGDRSDESSVTFQWFAGGTAIAGATASKVKVTTAMKGKKLAVAVTATKAAYEPVTVTSPATSRVAALPSVKIKGTARVGETMTAAVTGQVSGSAVSYRWYVGGKLATAKARTLKLGTAWAGKKVVLKVTATKSGHAKVSASSKGTAAIATKPFATVKVTLAGTVAVGKKLTAKVTVKPGATSVTYRWLRAGKTVQKGTSKYYRVTDKDAGKTLRVRVTVARQGYTTRSVSSGKVRLTMAHTSPAFFRQGDAAWSGVTFGGGAIGPTGCVPTSTAMALQGFGVNVNPRDVAQVMHSKGDYNNTGTWGASGLSVKAAGKYYGIPVKGVTTSAGVRQALQEGKSVIALVNPPIFTNPGSTHAILLSGYGTDGSTQVSNPFGSISRHTVRSVWESASTDPFDARGGARFWALG